MNEEFTVWRFAYSSEMLVPLTFGSQLADQSIKGCWYYAEHFLASENVMNQISPWTELHVRCVILNVFSAISLKLESFARKNYVSFSSCNVTPAGFGRTRQLFSGTFAWVNTPLNLSSPAERDFWWQLTFYSSTIIQNNRTLLRATPI